MIRAFAAGCFVFAAVLAVVVLLGALDLLETASPLVTGGGLAILLVALCVAALWLFNAKGTNPLGLQTAEEQIRELKAADLLETENFTAARCFRVEESEDEGLHYYLELTDGTVLFLSGQYLYDFEPVTDDPELNQPRRFPCTEFTILRHRSERFVLDIVCSGQPFEPELTTAPFSEKAWRIGALPHDGAIITGVSYEALKTGLVPNKVG